MWKQTASLLALGLFVLASLAMPSSRYGLREFAQQTKPTSTVVVTATIIPPESPTPQLLTYSDALKTYESVAKEAIDAAKGTLDLVKWVLSLFVVSILIASGLGAYLFNRARSAASEVARLNEMVSELRNTVIDVDRAARTAEQIGKAATESAESAKQLFDQISHRLDPLETRVSDQESLLAERVKLTKELMIVENIRRYRDAISSEDVNVRLQAVWALSEIPDPLVIPYLIDRLRRDVDPLVRGNAAYGLGRHKALEAIGDLLDATRDASPFVRTECTRALGEIGERSEDICERLREMANDPSEEVRAATDQALLKLECS